MESLGIRYNNPCNIRYNKLNNWHGQIGQYKGFCKFKSMDYGLRAALSILRYYRYNLGLDTIRKIITRFAPPSENNSEYYIKFVVGICNEYGYKLNADTSLNLDFFDYKGVCPLFCILRAICLIESHYFLEPAQYERSLILLHS